MASHLDDMDEAKLSSVSLAADLAMLRAYYRRLSWWQKILYQFGILTTPRTTDAKAEQ